jgi:hypothetical protein
LQAAARAAEGLPGSPGVAQRAFGLQQVKRGATQPIRPASWTHIEMNMLTESFAELFEKSEALSKLKPGTIVSGIVVEIRTDVVVVTPG